MDKVSIITTDGGEYIINDPDTQGCRRIKGTHSHAINAIESASLSIYADNPGFTHIKPRRTLVVIGEASAPEFVGRVVTSSRNVAQDGTVYKDVICEGYAGFLHDYAEPTARTVCPLFQDEVIQVLTKYNESLNMNGVALSLSYIWKDEYKDTETPTIDGRESMDAYEYLYAMFEALGLEWYMVSYTARSGDTPASVCIAVTGEHSELRDGKIKLGDNLISFSATENSADVCTILVAWGAKIYTDADNSERIGPVYATPQDTVWRTRYGDVRKSIVFDECTDMGALQTTAQQYVDKMNVSIDAVTIQAVDAKYIGKDTKHISVGDIVEVDVPLYEFDSPVRVNSITECIEDVSQNSYVFTTIETSHPYWYATIAERREKEKSKGLSDRVSSAVSLSNMTYNKGESNYQITTGRLDTVDETLVAYAGKFTTIETRNLKVDGELEAHTGKISTLESDNVTIHGTLTAHNAELDTLTANDVTITGELEAHTGKISTLESDNVTIKDTLIAHNAELDTLTANDVTITGELEAHTGKISTLESDNVTIKDTLTAQAGEFETLKSKSVTTDNLTTKLATIDVAKVGSTFTETLQTFSETSAKSVIDSAYIYNAIVNKMTVGDLKSLNATTETLALVSKDSKIAIGFKGATQQFYDKNGKVRVQIGQDANSNFNFAVIGSDGTTCLYDETGVKASALADNIIVTDMIADDAVTEDKVSFEFIKPNAQGGIDITQIYDGKGGLWGAEYTSFTETTNTNIATAQSTANTAKTNAATAQSTANTAQSTANTAQSTANTAKTNAATANANITTLTNTVSSVSSKVDANAKSITDKVWQSDITTSINSYDGTTGKTIRDRVTTVETNIDGITSTVSDMQSIGGRNLLKGTVDFSGGGYVGQLQTELISGCKVLYSSNTSDSDTKDVCFWNGKFNPEPSTKYTLSFYAKGSGEMCSFFYGYTVRSGYSNMGKKTTAVDGNIRHALSAEYKRYIITWTTRDDVRGIKNILPVRLCGIASVYVYGVKFEKGNVATDWTPAPEDIDADIDNINNKFNNYSTTSQMNSAITQKADSITSTVSATYATKTDLGTKASTSSVNSLSEDLADFSNETIAALSSMQNQIDGSIMTWFYSVAPTSTNVPASNWTTTDLKNKHLGDLYYDTVTGYCYRWQVLNNTYSWQRITDTDVTKALEDASKAQDTADSKRRVFTTTPTTPYEIGDLWSGGSIGELKRCKITRLTGSYMSSDWELATRYTDDTTANQIANNLSANYSTTTHMNSAITQKANEIISNVSSTYTTKEEFNNLEIGGRNLLRNSKNPKVIPSDWITNVSVVEYDAELGENVYAINTSTSTERVQSLERIRVEPNTEYTISTYFKRTSNVGGMDILFLSRKDSLSNPGARFDYIQSKLYSQTNPNEWERVTFIFTTKEDVYDGYVRFDNNRSTDGQMSKLLFTKFKLEKGSVATDWTPAPEDIDTQISTVYSELSQTIDGFKTTVSETYATNSVVNSKVSAVSQTADKINWLVKSGTSASDVTLTDRVYSVIAENINLTGKVTFSSLDSTAQGKITTAQSTADTAKTNAATAQSTAATAQSTANTAKTTADTAKTNAATAQSTAATAQTTANTAKTTADTAKTNAATAQSTADGIKTNIYTSGTTTIDGAKITTGSIKAEKIDVNELFSKAITATNLSITGGNISILAGYSEEKAIGIKFQTDGYNYVSSGIGKNGISHESISGKAPAYSKVTSSLRSGGLEIEKTIKESDSSGATQTTCTFKQSGTYGFSANCGINAGGNLYESGTALSAKYAKKAYTRIATVKGATAVSLSSSYTEFLVYVGEGSGTWFAWTFVFTRDSVNGTAKRLRNGGYKNSSENSNCVIVINSTCTSMCLEEATTNGIDSRPTTNVMVFGR